jgi:hypothetical protein
MGDPSGLHGRYSVSRKALRRLLQQWAKFTEVFRSPCSQVLTIYCMFANRLREPAPPS